VLGERLDGEADGFLAGEGVEVAADRVHLAGDVQRRPRTRPFEEHVLDKMRNAVGLGRFATGPGFNPYTHGDRPQVLHALGQHDQAVGKLSAAEISLVIHFVLFAIDCRPMDRKRHVGNGRAAQAATSGVAARLRGYAKILYPEPSRDRKPQPTSSIRR